jgi:ketosteroid isomerase-like protein
MSTENVNTVRRAYEAFNRGDVDEFLAAADDDVVQDWSRAVGPERGVFRGRDEVARFVRSWWDAFEESVVVVDELIDAGDHVVARFHARQRGRGSGAEVVGRGSILVWTFRDARVISATLYQDRDEALAAVRQPGALP